jgi:hypothetical protein
LQFLLGLAIWNAEDYAFLLSTHSLHFNPYLDALALPKAAVFAESVNQPIPRSVIEAPSVKLTRAQEPNNRITSRPLKTAFFSAAHIRLFNDFHKIILADVVGL